MSDSVQPHIWKPTRLPCPWDSPGKNTGVGCHFLLQCKKVKSESEVTQSCPTLSDPMDCSLPGSFVHGIFQARVLEWVAIAFSGESVINYLSPLPPEPPSCPYSTSLGPHRASGWTPYVKPQLPAICFTLRVSITPESVYASELLSCLVQPSPSPAVSTRLLGLHLRFFCVNGYIRTIFLDSIYTC